MRKSKWMNTEEISERKSYTRIRNAFFVVVILRVYLVADVTKRKKNGQFTYTKTSD